MRYLTFSEEKEAYPICLLVPTIRKDEIQKTYLDNSDIDPEDLLVMNLHYDRSKKKTPMVEMRRYIVEELVPVFNDMQTEYIIVTDGDYFKALTKASKIEANLGYVMESIYGPKVIYVPNSRSVFYNPEAIKAKIQQGLKALSEHRKGSYQAPGIDIIKFEAYPQTKGEIETWLKKLIAMDRDLTCDIETFSLKHNSSGIGTISFAWNSSEGISFPVDYQSYPQMDPETNRYGEQIHNSAIRTLLLKFFREFKRKITYHNIAFDAHILVYQLFMSDILDTSGMLDGMATMLRNWDDSKLITYLATNTCAGNKLSLKDQAQEYSGNYAMTDIEDITKIPLPDLLRYNLIDSLSTWYVKEKHWDTMIADQQLSVYEDIFKPATVDIVQMQLTGMPINMKRVGEVKLILEGDKRRSLIAIRKTKTVKKYTHELNDQWVSKTNAKLKVKRVSLADANVEFNPNSGPQLQDLLFEYLGLPVLSLTDAKQPSTDGDTLKALRNHTQDPDVLEFLNGMIEYNQVKIILNTFIPAMEGAVQGPDGWYYLFGNFNLGGALSGRLSSSKPNLQNIPAKSHYGKLIKSCFEAPPGWLFCGLDFDSLEDKISALTTKDPNKLKVYTDGYDGHSLRAYAYFGDKMPDIDPNNVLSINSIKKKYEPLREESKVPTFALTYDGTYITLMANAGFSETKAKFIEAEYHKLYEVSDQWVSAKLDQATKDGYVTVAFGLRVRTPLLHQVIRKTSKTPYEAEREGRSAGNALGQSWCLLNNRAGSEFMAKVRASNHCMDIKPCSQIHDAQYFLIRDDIDTLMYANEHLVQAVEWQQHPDITHDLVKLSGQLCIHYPTWASEIRLPNRASEKEILNVIDKHMS